MSEQRLRIAGSALAVAGALISGYLLLIRETGGTLVCATGGCETVQSSSYAAVFGVPTAAIGLIGFVALLAAGAARGEVARLGQATLALSACLFSAYLLVIQLAVIGAICQWCLVTDVITTALVLVALLRLQMAVSPTAARPPSLRQAPRRRR
jgi:uncharacterized membrane protein